VLLIGSTVKSAKTAACAVVMLALNAQAATAEASKVLVIIVFIFIPLEASKTSSVWSLPDWPWLVTWILVVKLLPHKNILAGTMPGNLLH
jgi:hypothetical protein